MPRVTKQQKIDELKSLQIQLARNVLMCMGYSINGTNNVVDDLGENLVFGKEGQKKYIKWGEGPFRRKEVQFDPINNYQLMVQLFSNFLNHEIEDNAGDPDGIQYVRSVSIKDSDEITMAGFPKRYVEVDIVKGALVSETYVTPTLGYMEIMFDLYGILPHIDKVIKRVDELKYELEQ